MLTIKSAETKDIPLIHELCNGNVLGTKVACQIDAYGIDRDFLSVWCCFNKNDNLLAVLCKFEDSLTVAGHFENEATDVRTFLDMIGFSTLCCDKKTAVALGYDKLVTKKAYVYTGSYTGEVCGELTEESYKSSYSLISKYIPDSFKDTKEAYLSFLSDFTYRKRRGLARIKGYSENGVAYSCALTSAETEKAAILSGVVCDPLCRKKGLGKQTVLSLAEELKSESKDVYVIALNESAEGFYERIGFRFKEIISFIERK